MNKQIRYTDTPIGDEPIGELKIIADSLPSPKELKFKSANTKVTISLSSESVAYFKAAAKANQMQYQKMIRQLLDAYVVSQKTRTGQYDERHEAYRLRDGVGPQRQPVGTPRSTSCLYEGKEISIDAALRIREHAGSSLLPGTFKCVKCNQPVRPHSEGENGVAAHFEHYEGNRECSLSSSR